MANLIQIKRSLTTATAPSLANGELAFTANGDHLFIGSNGASITIAGKFNPGVLTANQALVANGTSGIDKIITANAVVTTLTANGSTGTAGQILTSNGTVSYWADPSSSSFTLAGDSGTDSFSTGGTLTFTGANGLTTAVTNDQVTLSVDSGSTLVVNATGIHVNTANLSIATSQLTGDVALGTSTSGNYVATITAGSGISGSSSTEGGTPTIAVVAGSGIASNSTGVHVVAGSQGALISNASGVFVAGGNGIYTSSGVNVRANNGIVANSSGVFVNPGSTLTVNSAGVHVNSSLSITDLTLSGNLTVSGTLTTIDTANLVVEDPIIKLANGNGTTDSLDIGFYGQYGSSGSKFTGLFRDATDGIYKLYAGSQTEPTSTVDTGAAGYTTATLAAYLNSGALTTNATHVAITANSTVDVSITANSLTLATPLAVTSGGIGRASITAGAILVGNGSGATTVLAAATDGYVLQSNGTSVVYGTLDGGTF